MWSSTVPEVYGLILAGWVGAIVGSFLNVCIARLPAGESLIRPGSHCPRCGSAIAWYDNVPIVSWLLLRARCRRCRQPISIQYPLVEAATTAIWVAAAWHYGMTVTALAAVVFGTLLLGIAVTDARHYLIPDEYTWGGLVLGLLLALRDGPTGVVGAGLGAVTGFALLSAVAWAAERVFKREAMGGGDIKMLAMVGAFVGWKGTLLTVFGGSVLGTLVFVPLSIKRRRLVPFGVFLAVAAAVTFVAGDQLIRWYVGLLRG